MSKVCEALRPEDYGEEPLRSRDVCSERKAMAEEMLREARVKRYWGIYIELLMRIGGFAHVYKLALNVSDGVYPTQVVRHDYYDGNDANIDATIEARRREVWHQIRVLNGCLEKLGEKRVNEKGWRKFVNWALTERRRGSLREKARRCRKNGEFMSPEALVDWYLERHPNENFIEKFSAH